MTDRPAAPLGPKSGSVRASLPLPAAIMTPCWGCIDFGAMLDPSWAMWGGAAPSPQTPSNFFSTYPFIIIYPNICLLLVCFYSVRTPWGGGAEPFPPTPLQLFFNISICHHLSQYMSSSRLFPFCPNAVGGRRCAGAMLAYLGTVLGLCWPIWGLCWA